MAPPNIPDLALPEVTADPTPVPSEFLEQEPVTPRQCSVEGCTFFAGAAGLCSCCYREEFGCAPPPPPPRKQIPVEEKLPDSIDSVHGDEAIQDAEPVEAEPK